MKEFNIRRHYLAHNTEKLDNCIGKTLKSIYCEYEQELFKSQQSLWTF